MYDYCTHSYILFAMLLFSIRIFFSRCHRIGNGELSVFVHFNTRHHYGIARILDEFIMDTHPVRTTYEFIIIYAR